MMAKTTTCPFCGKEITTGILRGNAELLSVTDIINIACCPECYARYRTPAKLWRDRFTTKLANYEWETRQKLKGERLAQAFARYVEEAQAYAPRNNNRADGFGFFYSYNHDGFFGIAERQMTFLGGDVSAKDKIKAIDKNIDVNPLVFTKDDVSCLRYRLCNSNQLGLFSVAYSVEICLNQNAGITFKPCYAKSVVLVKGLFGYKKKARREVQAMLQTFQSIIGTNLPIEEVRKFR